MTEEAKQLGNELAYPLIESEKDYPCSISIGLTKREYFAGLAMQGLCANPKMNDYTIQVNAETAKEIACALLEELSKTE